MRQNYHTKQREFLIGFFQSQPLGCFTAEDVLRGAKESGVAIGLATVYRNLEKLCAESALLKRLLPPDNKAHYQYREQDKNGCGGHYHLACTGCGQIAHVACDYLSGIGGHLRREHRFDFENDSAVFYGRCEKCQKTANPATVKK